MLLANALTTSVRQRSIYSLASIADETESSSSILANFRRRCHPIRHYSTVAVKSVGGATAVPDPDAANTNSVAEYAGNV